MPMRACTYVPGVRWRTTDDCDRCGWNPEVKKRRDAAIFGGAVPRPAITEKPEEPPRVWRYPHSWELEEMRKRGESL